MRSRRGQSQGGHGRRHVTDICTSEAPSRRTVPRAVVSRADQTIFTSHLAWGGSWVGLTGFEPATLGLGVPCSVQLSYSPVTPPPVYPTTPDEGKCLASAAVCY